jgi:CBS domain-containing protein
MSICDLYLKRVATVLPETTLEDAIEVMRDYGVDDVIVIETKAGLPIPVGILTGHDIVMRAYRLNAGNEKLTVRQVMTHNLITCKPTFGVFETIELMQRCSVKRLPVVGEAGELLGIITASDIFAMLGDELSRLTSRPNLSPWISPRSNFDHLNQ